MPGADRRFGAKACFLFTPWLVRLLRVCMYVKRKRGSWQENIMLSGEHHGCSMRGGSILSSR